MRLWRNIEVLAAFTQQKLIQLRKHLLLLYSVIVIGISFPFADFISIYLAYLVTFDHSFIMVYRPLSIIQQIRKET